MADSKQRVAILGGGIGSMSAALALTETDPTGERFDITVYQLGWRLGGKTASGRNPQYGQRIEEHGLHVWSGAYDNAFTVMRIVFNALQRPQGTPLANIADAFKRQNRPIIAQSSSDGWSPWPFWFQPDQDPNLFPGRDSLFEQGQVMPSLAEQLRRLFAAIEYIWNHDLVASTTVSPQLQVSAERFGAIHAAAGKLDSNLQADRIVARNQLLEHLSDLHALVSPKRRNQTLDDSFGRALILVELITIVGYGILANNCVEEGLHVLDQFDFRQFLRTYPSAQAPEDASIADCPIVVALYDYVFGYAEGSRQNPSLSACSALQAAFRLIFTYHAAFFYKATAGFGDTIFTPIYQLLKNRNVKFKFFHKVTGLVPDAGGTTIDSILIERQAALLPGVDEYKPFVTVNEIDCWPDAPFWDQIVDGARLAAMGVDFEDYYSPEPPGAEALPPLQLGRDFDQVVLGISVGALGTICTALIDQKPGWADMVSKLATTRTQALQLWIDEDVHALGGPFVAPVTGPAPETLGPIVTAYVSPLDTYSDMSQLLPAEAWPEPPPRSVAYFCGVMSDGEAPNNAVLATEKAKANALSWMTTNLHGLWTNIGQGADFHWDFLHWPDPGPTGPARLDAQYWRANISPSERYVLSLPGTLQYRLEPGKSGYDNLFLAGDWTKVPDVNVGCVEVGVMSGLAAASALSGVTIPIVCCNTLYPPLPAALAATGQGVPQTARNA